MEEEPRRKVRVIGVDIHARGAVSVQLLTSHSPNNGPQHFPETDCHPGCNAAPCLPTDGPSDS